MSNYQPGGDTETNNIGALADGFLGNTAINDPDTSNGSTAYIGGLANGDNRDNTTNTDNSDNSDNSNNSDNSDNSSDITVDATLDLLNGNNRDNSYDWDYDSKTTNTNINDADTKTTTITDTDVKSDYDWSYDSKSYSDNDINTKTDTDIKTITDTDVKTTTTSDSFNTADSFNKTDNDTTNTADSFNKSDDDFATVHDVKDFDNLGIAGGDVNFNLGDNFSFTLDVDNILNGSLGGGNAFNAIQANHLADQDSVWSMKMDAAHASNSVSTAGNTATGAEGIDLGHHGGWTGGAGDDVNGSSVADASSILANSGIHMELVQGANMLSNTFDAIGHDSNTVGQDSHDGA